MRKKISLFALGIILSVSGVELAEEPSSIETDRPDFTETSTIVPKGYVQLESGATVYKIDDATNTVMGEMLIRFDTTIPKLEGRLGIPNYHSDSLKGSKTTGIDDISLGVKIEFLKPIQGKAAAGILTAYIPSGSDNYKRDKIETEAKLCISMDLPHEMKIGSNLGLALADDNNTRFIRPFTTVVLGKSWTEKWGSYVEWFGIFQDSPGGKGEHQLDGGITYLLAPDTQLDVRGGFGLNGRSTDYFFGVGFSKRVHAF